MYLYNDEIIRVVNINLFLTEDIFLNKQLKYEIIICPFQKFLPQKNEF